MQRVRTLAASCAAKSDRAQPALLISIAKGYAGRGVPLAGLLEEANLVLERGAELRAKRPQCIRCEMFEGRFAPP